MMISIFTFHCKSSCDGSFPLKKLSTIFALKVLENIDSFNSVCVLKRKLKKTEGCIVSNILQKLMFVKFFDLYNKQV